MTVDTDFAWPRAYCIELSEPRAPIDSSVAPGGTLAGGVALDGEGRPLDGERRLDSGSLIQRGSGYDTLRPLIVPSLCLEFARLEETPAACQGFAKRWGFLEKPAAENAWEPLSVWYVEIERMRLAIRHAEAGPLVPNDYIIGRAHIVLRPGPDGIVIVTRPATLLSALWLQLGQHLSGGAKFNSCDNCGSLFVAGRPGGRRRVARFCSPSCKNAWHNARRTASDEI